MKAPFGAYSMGSPRNGVFDPSIKPGADLDRHSIDLSKPENHLLQRELAEFDMTAANEFRNGDRRYAAPSDGEAKLLNSLANLFNQFFNPVFPVTPSDVAPAAGGAKALDALLRGICDPGDGILVPGPCWNGFDPGSWAKSSIQPVVVNTLSFEDTLTIKIISALSRAMDQSPCRIKALLITNPHIPFGQCYPLEVLEACVRFCNQRGIHFISDEEYGLTSFPSAEIPDPVPFISALSLDDRALGCDPARSHTIYSISRDFGASNFHMACSITQGDDELVAKLTRTCRPQISAASAAFNSALLSSPSLPFLIAMNSARLAESYILITSFLLRYEIMYIPVNAGLGVFARLCPSAKTWDDEAAIVRRLRAAGVLVNAGRQYHGVPREKGWVRLSFSVEKSQLQEALRRIENALGFTS